MTLEEAVALLREARKAVGDYDCYDCGIRDEPVWARIDAALAAREAEVRSEVEFAEGCGDLDNAAWEEMHKDFFVANPDDYTTLDAMLIPSAGYWAWSVAIEQEACGRAATLEEAKTTAIRAVKGLR